MNPDEGARELLLEIVHCPNVLSCLQSPSRSHVCRRIVVSQRSQSIDRFQVPEPWSGRLREAPLLFLSSNPSISETDQYPTRSWRDYEIEAYFYHRFEQSIVGGIRTRQQDGSFSKPVRFWSEVRSRAAELYERAVTPGEDYALTEVVHCNRGRTMASNRRLRSVLTDTCRACYCTPMQRSLSAWAFWSSGSLQRSLGYPRVSGFMDPLRFAAKSATSCFRRNQTRTSHGNFRRRYVKTSWLNSERA
jgi:hypothetical protein